MILFLFLLIHYKKRTCTYTIRLKKFASKSICYKDDLLLLMMNICHSSLNVLNDSALKGSALFVTFCRNF